MMDHFVKKRALDCPVEHQEEMKQEAYVRILNSYEKLDVTRGWKSFVFNHCRGAIMDYQKFGIGFAENRWSLQKTTKKRNTTFKINSRIDFDRDNQSLDLDTVMANHGLFASINTSETIILWPLVESMAQQDETIHIFAKALLGFDMCELAEIFGLSRGRICQIIELFIERFDDPQLVDDLWFKQTCYAFGLCKVLGMPEVDQSDVVNYQVGWSTNKADLYSYNPVKIPQPEQMSWIDQL